MIGIMFLYILIGAGALCLLSIYFPFVGNTINIWVYKKNIGWFGLWGIIIPVYEYDRKTYFRNVLLLIIVSSYSVVIR